MQSYLLGLARAGSVRFDVMSRLATRTGSAAAQGRVLIELEQDPSATRTRENDAGERGDTGAPEARTPEHETRTALDGDGTQRAAAEASPLPPRPITDGDDVPPGSTLAAEPVSNTLTAPARALAEEEEVTSRQVAVPPSSFAPRTPDDETLLALPQPQPSRDEEPRKSALPRVLGRPPRIEFSALPPRSPDAGTTPSAARARAALPPSGPEPARTKSNSDAAAPARPHATYRERSEAHEAEQAPTVPVQDNDKEPRDIRPEPRRTERTDLARSAERNPPGRIESDALVSAARVPAPVATGPGLIVQHLEVRVIDPAQPLPQVVDPPSRAPATAGPAWPAPDRSYLVRI
ncbi:MAG TPA: hypothetical protein VJN18_06470 [Polyangiaceae bacterium]|nr:hypothetical protein [Polyangiaceae bacterium]